MSKKLLLNNNVVNEVTPIQNGLVCWLDAFDLTEFKENTIWIDRTNNNNGTVTNYSSYPTSSKVINGELLAQGTVNIPNPTKGLSNYTVEVGYQDLGKKYWLGIWGNTSETGTNYSKGLSLYQENNLIGSHPSLYTPIENNDIKLGKNYLTVAINSGKILIYRNGQKLLSYNTSTRANGSEILPSEADYFCFMGRKPNNVTVDTNIGVDFVLSKWYYLRIYNRTLTDNEIINNYNYELTLSRG